MVIVWNYAHKIPFCWHIIGRHSTTACELTRVCRIAQADLVTDPLEVFRFMEARGIGATTAVFYEERGRFYEENGMLAEAEEAYLTGIRAKATPFSQLQDAYRRCRARRAHAAAEHEPSATPSPATAQPKRLVLGTLKGKVGTFRDSTLGAGLADLSPAPARAANFAKYTVAADTPPPVKGAAQGFPTFTPLATPQRARRDELRTPLHERVLRDNAWVLPPEREGSKENVLQATQWTAFREPLTVRKPGKASIFVDPELDTRPRTEVKRPRPSARASCAAGAQGASVRRPDERLCFATELVMRDGAEYRSFEECRAEKYLAHMRDGGVVRETCGGRESADDLLAVLGGLVSPTSTTPPAPASTSTPTPADTSADTSVDAILASLGLGGLCTKRGREPADDATPSPKHGAEDADVAALLASVGGSAV